MVWHSYQKYNFLLILVSSVSTFSMASLLAKFRIDYSDLKMIPNIIKKPQEETQNFYNSLIKDLIVSDECNQEKENRRKFLEQKHIILESHLFFIWNDCTSFITTMEFHEISVFTAAK